jgi:hypothetical protein
VFERDQKRRPARVYTPRIESHIEQHFKAGVIQHGCFFGISVVQQQDGGCIKRTEIANRIPALVESH